MFTLTNTINYINQALNYPSASFIDLKLFFNQAISELNSTLHISIRDIDSMINENRQKISNMQNIIYLSEEPKSTDNIFASNTEPSDLQYYFNTATNKFGKLIGSVWHYFDELYAVVNNFTSTPKTYKAIRYASDIVIWILDELENPLDVDLENYFTVDWIMLFIIPYVAFKYSIRDGDTGASFSEDFAQGFQQLNNAYNIPSKVYLHTQAGKFAYGKDVLDNINNLNIYVPTRAITEDMKIPKSISASYGGFYDNGGFGI